MSPNALIFPTLLAVVALGVCAGSGGAESTYRITLQNVATTDEGITIKIAFSPKRIDSEKIDIVSVYLIGDCAKVPPLDVFGRCNRMWLFVGPHRCYFSTVLKAANEGSPTFRVFGARPTPDEPSDEEYLGQIVVLSRGTKELGDGGSLQIRLPKRDRNRFYRKSGKLHIWMARRDPPPPPRTELPEAERMAAFVVKARSRVSNVLTTEIAFDKPR